MEVLAITQARSGSTRLPNKVLKTIGNQTLLDIHLQRILKSKKIDQLLVATTVDELDLRIVEIAKAKDLPFYQGSIANVLDRFYQAAVTFKPKWVVRLTSDCPLIDAELIDSVINYAIEKDVDYCSNTLRPSFPDGMDIEVFKFSALEKAWNEARLDSEKEHVTPFIHKNSSFNGLDLFRSENYKSDTDFSDVRLTVDEPEDLEVVKLVIEKLGLDKDWRTYADFYILNKEINELNGSSKRNEGYDKSLKED
jgi:spore coat polysaccharide biosynthesis protein SpsF